MKNTFFTEARIFAAACIVVAALAAGLSGCAEKELVEVSSGSGTGNLKIQVSIPQTKSGEGYDALAYSTVRIYQIVRGSDDDMTENLVRRYKPASSIPSNLYLVAGEYRITVEAGTGDEATFTNKTYYGESTFTLEANKEKTVNVECKVVNSVVKVVFDETVRTAFDEGFRTYVSAADEFDRTAAENGTVPTLEYTSDNTGFFILPEDVSNLSWGFYGESSDADIEAKGTKTGVIENAQEGVQYTLTYKYSKESMRGGHTELTSPDADKSKPAGNGLDKEYITQWSYGKMETLTLLIPDSKGGASGPLAENERAVKAADPQLRPYLSQVDRYWGDQPFTAGPVYVGALIFFLFVLGCFIVRTPLKWALLVVTILTIMLSWGKNMMWLTDWFIDYFPMYNRFRTVSSILVVAEFCMPLLAVLALKKIFDDPSILSREKRWFYLSGGIVAGIALLAALFPTMFDSFLKDYELEAAGQPGYAELFAGIAEARQAVFTADAWRSFIIVALGFAVLWLLCQKKLNPTVAMIALVVILVGDMYPVNKRYLNSDNFVTPARKTNPFPMTDADRYILQDKDMNYRVLNAAAGETLASAFSEPRTSYYHKSIGGYHAAKLRRYQDLIDRQLVNANPAVLNMLNTRYIIQPLEDGRETVVRNPGALGNAWFVSEVKWVDNADAEMAAITDFDPSHTAVADRHFAREIGDKIVPPAAGDTIYETGYKPDELTYRYRSQQGGLAVFSEIYFPWGWQVTVDGKPVDMARVNYVLRAVNLPAGEHEVIFRFDPPSVHTTEAIAYVSLFLILAAFVGTGFVAWKRRKSVPQNS